MQTGRELLTALADSTSADESVRRAAESIIIEAECYTTVLRVYLRALIGEFGSPLQIIAGHRLRHCIGHHAAALSDDDVSTLCATLIDSAVLHCTLPDSLIKTVAVCIRNLASLSDIARSSCVHHIQEAFKSSVSTFAAGQVEDGDIKRVLHTLMLLKAVLKATKLTCSDRTPVFMYQLLTCTQCVLHVSLRTMDLMIQPLVQSARRFRGTSETEDPHAASTAGSGDRELMHKFSASVGSCLVGFLKCLSAVPLVASPAGDSTVSLAGETLIVFIAWCVHLLTCAVDEVGASARSCSPNTAIMTLFRGQGCRCIAGTWGGSLGWAMSAAASLPPPAVADPSAFAHPYSLAEILLDTVAPFFCALEKSLSDADVMAMLFASPYRLDCLRECLPGHLLDIVRPVEPGADRQFNITVGHLLFILMTVPLCSLYENFSTFDEILLSLSRFVQSTCASLASSLSLRVENMDTSTTLMVNAAAPSLEFVAGTARAMLTHRAKWTQDLPAHVNAKLFLHANGIQAVSTSVCRCLAAILGSMEDDSIELVPYLNLLKCVVRTCIPLTCTASTAWAQDPLGCIVAERTEELASYHDRARNTLRSAGGGLICAVLAAQPDIVNPFALHLISHPLPVAALELLREAFMRRDRGCSMEPLVQCLDSVFSFESVLYAIGVAYWAIPAQLSAELMLREVLVPFCFSCETFFRQLEAIDIAGKSDANLDELFHFASIASSAVRYLQRRSTWLLGQYAVEFGEEVLPLAISCALSVIMSNIPEAVEGDSCRNAVVYEMFTSCFYLMDQPGFAFEHLPQALAELLSICPRSNFLLLLQAHCDGTGAAALQPVLEAAVEDDSILVGSLVCAVNLRFVLQILSSSADSESFLPNVDNLHPMLQTILRVIQAAVEYPTDLKTCRLVILCVLEQVRGHLFTAMPASVSTPLSAVHIGEFIFCTQILDSLSELSSQIDASGCRLLEAPMISESYSKLICDVVAFAAARRSQSALVVPTFRLCDKLLFHAVALSNLVYTATILLADDILCTALTLPIPVRVVCSIINRVMLFGFASFRPEFPVNHEDVDVTLREYLRPVYGSDCQFLEPTSVALDTLGLNHVPSVIIGCIMKIVITWEAIIPALQCASVAVSVFGAPFVHMISPLWPIARRSLIFPSPDAEGVTSESSAAATLFSRSILSQCRALGGATSWSPFLQDPVVQYQHLAFLFRKLLGLITVDDFSLFLTSANVLIRSGLAMCLTGKERLLVEEVPIVTVAAMLFRVATSFVDQSHALNADSPTLKLLHTRLVAASLHCAQKAMPRDGEVCCCVEPISVQDLAYPLGLARSFDADNDSNAFVDVALDEASDDDANQPNTHIVPAFLSEIAAVVGSDCGLRPFCVRPLLQALKL